MKIIKKTFSHLIHWAAIASLIVISFQYHFGEKNVLLDYVITAGIVSDAWSYFAAIYVLLMIVFINLIVYSLPVFNGKPQKKYLVHKSTLHDLLESECYGKLFPSISLNSIGNFISRKSFDNDREILPDSWNELLLSLWRDERIKGTYIAIAIAAFVCLPYFVYYDLNGWGHGSAVLTIVIMAYAQIRILCDLTLITFGINVKKR